VRRASIALLLAGLAGCERVEPVSAPRAAPPVIKTAGGEEMVALPAGEFTMGSRRGREDEVPLHPVRVDAFFIDRMEVTQALYERFKLPNPSKSKGGALPVHMMSWALAAKFCNERSRAEGLEPCYNEETAECDFSRNGYRLPTEAEWEYACRAGGADDEVDARPLRDRAWFAENSQERTHPVGQKAPNAWGLHDMLGNVAEWCNDVYDKEYYGKSPPANPRGPEDGRHYSVRGGSFKSSPEALRPAARSYDNPGFSDACLAPETLGIRCVRRAPQARSAFLQDRRPTGLVYQDLYLEHKTGPSFPERPARLEAIMKRVREKGLAGKLLDIKPMEAPEDWIATVHTKDYMDRVRKACEGLGDRIGQIDTGDMPISSRSYEVALAAVGGVLAAVDAVVEGKARNAFCAIRPPGHHARKERAKGFCLFNNVAIAARYLQGKHKVARVLIVDWDVHHGDGTQEAFWTDGSVLYFSTHLSPFYPGTGEESERGEGKAEGLILNVPLKAGQGDREVLEAYEKKLKPAALAFKPDFVLVSCGFDSHENDTLGRLAITTEGFGRMTRIVREIAETTAKGRLVSMLEGGYNLENLANASEAHLRALME
jgi:acetoin utilization deacetylase AcuC-like enzyme/formylglycine-generating enzyme required for sulfatase activity